MGLLGWSGAGACPNLLQRRSGPESAADEIAEYQRSSPCAPVRSGPLQQIWTTYAPADPRERRRGPGGGRSGRPPGAETCTSHSKVQFQPSFSSAKCTSRRGRGRSRSSRSAATAPSRNIPGEPARKAHCAASGREVCGARGERCAPATFLSRRAALTRRSARIHYALFRLLRPFALHCTRKRSAAEGEGAQ